MSKKKKYPLANFESFEAFKKFAKAETAKYKEVYVSTFKDDGEIVYIFLVTDKIKEGKSGKKIDECATCFFYACSNPERSDYNEYGSIYLVDGDEHLYCDKISRTYDTESKCWAAEMYEHYFLAQRKNGIWKAWISGDKFVPVKLTRLTFPKMETLDFLKPVKKKPSRPKELSPRAFDKMNAEFPKKGKGKLARTVTFCV